MKPETVIQSGLNCRAKGILRGGAPNFARASVELSLWTRENSVKALIKAYKAAEEERQASGMTGAIKELNAMHGFNAPTEVAALAVEFIFTVKRASADDK